VSARSEILDALVRAGYSQSEAVALQELADKDARTPTGLGDPEFPPTLEGGHALIVEYGDEEIYGTCQCGKALAKGRPDQSIDRFCGPWERHVMTEVPH
jgi:hypothetical protein